MKKADEVRLEGANWDEPVVAVRANGSSGTMKRKVLTKGVKTIQLGGIMREVKESLRQGYEIRLADENGNEVMRVYPIASIDCDCMRPAAQIMGVGCDWLAGKRLRVRHRDHEVRREEYKSMIASARERGQKYRSATPDMMVTCPKCGESFRVGRRLAA